MQSFRPPPRGLSQWLMFSRQSHDRATVTWHIHCHGPMLHRNWGYEISSTILGLLSHVTALKSSVNWRRPLGGGRNNLPGKRLRCFNFRPWEVRNVFSSRMTPDSSNTCMFINYMGYPCASSVNIQGTFTSFLVQPRSLALLDCVSIAHEIEICLSSVHLSVRRLCHKCMSQLSMDLMHLFLSNFGCCFPWAIRRGNF